MGDALRQRWGGLGVPANAFAAGTFQLNENGDSVGAIFEPRLPVTITRLGFLCTDRNGTGVTWKISLQGVNASTGYPDGTDKGGGSPASKTFTNSSVTDDEFNWYTIDNAYAAGRGEPLAIVIARSSGTAGGGEDLTVAHHGGWTVPVGMPYSFTIDAATVTSTKFQHLPIIGCGTNSVAYGGPLKGGLTQAFGSGSSPAIYGLKFNIPTNFCSTYTVAGVRVLMSVPAASTHSTVMRLYSGTTVLQDKTIDTEIAQGTSVRLYEWYFDESTLVTLDAGSTYRFAFAPATSGNISLRGLTFTSADDMAAWPFGGGLCLSSLSGGVWTDTATSRPFIELILEDITAPSSSGGLLRHPGMTGGFSG